VLRSITGEDGQAQPIEPHASTHRSGSQGCAPRPLAPGEGFEPPSTESKSAVLPLDDPGLSAAERTPIVVAGRATSRSTTALHRPSIALKAVEHASTPAAGCRAALQRSLVVADRAADGADLGVGPALATEQTGARHPALAVVHRTRVGSGYDAIRRLSTRGTTTPAAATRCTTYGNVGYGGVGKPSASPKRSGP
jgi:hypothetical protein